MFTAWRGPAASDASAATMAAAALAAATGGAAWAIAGAAGLAYATVVALGAAAGLPWGWRLFGRRHAAGWLAGLALGYAEIGLLWWAVCVEGGAGPGAAVAAWFALLAASVALTRPKWQSPLVDLPRWRPAHLAWLLGVLLLVPALTARPFALIGMQDDSGARRFATYFTADFVWHMALVEELAKKTSPPVDPYLAPEPLHYYWTYFLVPAAALDMAPGLAARDALAVNAQVCGLLFVAALYLGAWLVAPDSPRAVALAVALVLLCGSAEGPIALAGLAWLGEPLSRVREVNVDALAAWVFRGLRVDNLPRALWYTPQHAMAFCLASVALLVPAAAAAVPPLAAILLAGAFLALATTYNPFVGGVCCLTFGVAAIWNGWRRGALLPSLRYGLAAAPVLAAVAWCARLQITGGLTGAAFAFGRTGPSANAPLVCLALTFAPLALLAAAGVWLARHDWPAAMTAALVGTTLSLLAMHTITLRVDPHWIGFRTGHLIFSWMPALIVSALVALHPPARRRLASAAILVVLAAGLPTTVIDAFHAQDVHNLAMGPGFHWTQTITPQSGAALAWIRAHTAPADVVQAEPIVRGRESWSLVPSHAGRRMAAGLPISLQHTSEYDRRSQIVQRLFSTDDAGEAHRLARALGIDYLYLDAIDRAAYPAVAKFDRESALFSRVFHRGDVSIVAVK